MNIVRFLRLAVVMMAGCCLTAPTVASAATAPGIVTPPASQVVFVGSNITFTVLATGTEPLRYQWRKGGINLGGATNSSLIFTNAPLTNAGSYTVVVSNGVNPPATSPPALLTVTPVPALPDILTQPTNLAVVAGGTATFVVEASGFPPPTYQWYFGTGPDGVLVSGGTNATLVLKKVSPTNAGLYCCLVRNTSDYYIVSEMARLTVLEHPRITLPPASVSVTNPWPLSTNDLTEVALADQVLELTILGGAMPFPTNGSFQIKLTTSLSDPANHLYSIPGDGAMAASAGNWAVITDLGFDTVLRLSDARPGGGEAKVVLLSSGRYEMYADGLMRISSAGSASPACGPVRPCNSRSRRKGRHR